jgi:hypothetical protein
MFWETASLMFECRVQGMETSENAGTSKAAKIADVLFDLLLSEEC